MTNLHSLMPKQPPPTPQDRQPSPQNLHRRIRCGCKLQRAPTALLLVHQQRLDNNLGKGRILALIQSSPSLRTQQNSWLQLVAPKADTLTMPSASASSNPQTGFRPWPHKARAAKTPQLVNKKTRSRKTLPVPALWVSMRRKSPKSINAPVKATSAPWFKLYSSHTELHCTTSLCDFWTRARF